MAVVPGKDSPLPRDSGAEHLGLGGAARVPGWVGAIGAMVLGT